jgi:hypothetical protein
MYNISMFKGVIEGYSFVVILGLSARKLSFLLSPIAIFTAVIQIGTDSV